MENMNAKRRKKESIVIFEDWFKYARCLNDTQFRELMSAILDYYKTQETPLFTGLQLDVWNDIIEDLEINISKRQSKRDTMLRNSRTNPKLNIVPDTKPNIEPNIEPNIVPKTAGMVDGRWDMVDGKMVDGKMGDEYMVDKGETVETITPDTPLTQSELVDLKFTEKYGKWE